MFTTHLSNGSLKQDASNEIGKKSLERRHFPNMSLESLNIFVCFNLTNSKTKQNHPYPLKCSITQLYHATFFLLNVNDLTFAIKTEALSIVVFIQKNYPYLPSLCFSPYTYLYLSLPFIFLGMISPND